MKAAIYRGIGQIAVEEIDPPKMSESEALVKVGMVGVCGTDLKTFLKGHHMFQPPCILGHELTGRIVKKGKQIQEEFEEDSYVFAPYIECGQCSRCKKGVPELCKNKPWIEGAFAEYVTVPREILLRGALMIPKGIEEKVMTLTEPLACAIHGIQKARINPEDKVLVVGCGPMGLLIGIALLSMGVSCWVSDIDEKRLAMANQCGLESLNFDKKGFSAFMQQKNSYDSIILANALCDLVPQLMPLVSPGGTFQLFGGMPKETRIEIDPYDIHYREVDLVGSFGFSEKDFKKAFQMIIQDPGPFSELITEVYDFHDIRSALDAATKKENIKVVVKMT